MAEVAASHKTEIGETTCRRVTYRHGRAAEAVVGQEVARLQAEGLPKSPGPAQLAISADGSFIRLTNGAWREVKGLAVGEFETVYSASGKEVGVKTRKLSYFTRSYRVREFETYALAELARRGLGQAKTVVAVNDGAEWLQSFVNYHCPQAVRILDFAHALGHVAEAGRTIWGEGSDAFNSWYARTAHQLKHRPPQHTLAELQLLRLKAKNDDQADVLDRTHYYLKRRVEMMDYPYFQRRGYPIGSGSVESAHKQLVQRRFKQAGMRWAPHHVDPLLALRDLHGNKRWDKGWDEIVAFQRQQRQQLRCQHAVVKQPEPTTAITFPALEAAGLIPAAAEAMPDPPAKTKRDSKDHPWRRDLWPTKESWRWSNYRQQK